MAESRPVNVGLTPVVGFAALREVPARCDREPRSRDASPGENCPSACGTAAHPARTQPTRGPEPRGCSQERIASQRPPVPSPHAPEPRSHRRRRHRSRSRPRRAGGARRHRPPDPARSLPFSAAHYLETGAVLTDADVENLRRFDAILLGAVGGAPNDPRLAGGVIEKGILLKLRFDLDQYVNFRPVKLYPASTHRWRAAAPTTSTSSASARTPKASTPAWAAWPAPAPRRKSARRRCSPPPSASSAAFATPSGWRRTASGSTSR